LLRKPIRVALVCKASSPGALATDDRQMGWWSYPVPEFTWHHVPVGKPYSIDTRKWERWLDLVVVEDVSVKGRFTGPLPTTYLVFDSTLSDGHYRSRLENARQADLVLLDHDRLGRFAGLGQSLARFNYCVNDRLFFARGLERTLDVSFHCNRGGPSDGYRKKVGVFLAQFCAAEGLTYCGETISPQEYALSLARSKITVSWPRTPLNRPHRTFDAMASDACLVTGPLPYVEGDDVVAGHHYAEFHDVRELGDVILSLLANGRYKGIAANGRQLVHAQHTWRVRAQQLHSLIADVFAGRLAA